MKIHIIENTHNRKDCPKETKKGKETNDLSLLTAKPRILIAAIFQSGRVFKPGTKHGSRMQPYF